MPRTCIFWGVLAGELLLGQVRPATPTWISFPPEFQAAAFQPDLISAGSAGRIHFLDTRSRRIARLEGSGSVKFAGGFGRGADAFFDPVDLLTIDLQVLVCDRSENRLLFYDPQLNFSHEYLCRPPGISQPLYPEFLVTDDWGALLFYSQSTHRIWRLPSYREPLAELIDFRKEREAYDCITSLAIRASGDVAVLLSCHHKLVIFNRLGRRLREYRIDLSEPRFVFGTPAGWLILNTGGEYQELRPGSTGGVIQLPLEAGTILDGSVFNKRLFLLTNRKVAVIKLDSEF